MVNFLNTSFQVLDIIHSMNSIFIVLYGMIIL